MDSKADRGAGLEFGSRLTNLTSTLMVKGVSNTASRMAILLSFTLPSKNILRAAHLRNLSHKVRLGWLEFYRNILWREHASDNVPRSCASTFAFLCNIPPLCQKLSSDQGEAECLPSGATDCTSTFEVLWRRKAQSFCLARTGCLVEFCSVSSATCSLHDEVRPCARPPVVI